MEEILARGWGGLVSLDSAQSDSVMFVEEAPHSCLLPGGNAVVHHGGCGATAAGLPPISQRRQTVEHLCRAIEIVMNDSTKRENATMLGTLLRKENGTLDAAAFITQWMSDRRFRKP